MPETSRALPRRALRWRAWPAALVLALGLTGCGTTSERSARPPATTATATTAPATTAPATGGPSGGGPAARPGLTREHLRVDGRTRRYLLHRPATGTTPRPLVIAFHGRGSDPGELRVQSRLAEDARARGMLIAFPEGLHQGWGAGTRPTRQRPDPDLDVRFAEALVDELIRTERADPERVYAVGFSNGGSMALRMAAQRPDLLAGAAAVSGQLPSGPAAVRPTGPVPVMIVYGADDPVRPLGGWPSPPPDPAEPITPTLSARASAQAFATAGGAGRPVTTAGKGYDRTVWRLKDSPATVQLLVVHGGGHTWPGSDMTPPDGFGPTSRALDATGTILAFFADARGEGRTGAP
ncbi:prolyl oligopeptidase family serine peptidase [Streptomyces sp. PRKS01-65]|nr:PHB depolymerase family esterase [Streptomyces harenosi]NEY31431.1 prolyl oligopeptidase family serine peptidase [Streptomyces harenosi]